MSALHRGVDDFFEKIDGTYGQCGHARFVNGKAVRVVMQGVVLELPTPAALAARVGACLSLCEVLGVGH